MKAKSGSSLIPNPGNHDEADDDDDADGYDDDADDDCDGDDRDDPNAMDNEIHDNNASLLCQLQRKRYIMYRWIAYQPKELANLFVG